MKQQRKPLSAALKDELFHGGHTCYYCGDAKGPYEVDHIRPLARGGKHERGNLVVACIGCNRDKGMKLLHEWIQYRKTNGLFWPPVASHPTEPKHYMSVCHDCRDDDIWNDDNWKRYLPVDMELSESRTYYQLTYRCDEDHVWLSYSNSQRRFRL